MEGLAWRFRSYYLIAALFSIRELFERAPNGRTNDLILFSLAHVGINFSNCVFVQPSPNTRTQSVKTSFVQLHAEEVSLPHGRKPGERCDTTSGECLTLRGLCRCGDIMSEKLFGVTWATDMRKVIPTCCLESPRRHTIQRLHWRAQIAMTVRKKARGHCAKIAWHDVVFPQHSHVHFFLRHSSHVCGTLAHSFPGNPTADASRATLVSCCCCCQPDGRTITCRRGKNCSKARSTRADDGQLFDNVALGRLFQYGGEKDSDRRNP